jgi:hypothetical protein
MQGGNISNLTAKEAGEMAAEDTLGKVGGDTNVETATEPVQAPTNNVVPQTATDTQIAETAPVTQRGTSEAKQSNIPQVNAVTPNNVTPQSSNGATVTGAKQIPLSDGAKVVSALTTDRGTAPTWDDITAYAKTTGDSQIISDVNTAIGQGDVV